MDDTIITIYCLCEEFLEAIGHRDDPQVRLSTAEVMPVPLVSAAFFSGNIDKTRLFLHEYGYMKEMISKSRLNHRPPLMCCALGNLASNHATYRRSQGWQ
jgi:hypothetical protein